MNPETPSTLTDLLARVESAEGPDQRKTMVAVFEALVPLIERHPDGYVAQAKFFGLLDAGGFTDAALALCERVLPSGQPGVFRLPNRDRKQVWQGQIEPLNGDAQFALHQAPALALLAAMLKALVAEAAGPTTGSSHRLDEPILSKGGGESPR